MMCDINDLRSLLHGTNGSSRVGRTAIVFLTRLVLEKALASLWEVAFSGIRKERRYTYKQFTCLKQLVRDEHIDMETVIAERIHFSWATLSKGCHYQEYELTPTIPELKLWIDDVEELLEDLRIFHDDHTEEK